MTDQEKLTIDKLSYHQLLSRWRFADIGDLWFQGEKGEYWKKRMLELKDTVDHISISKELEW